MLFRSAKLLEQEVTNYTGRSFHRMMLKLGVVYQTGADIADAIPGLLEAAVERAGQRFVRASFIAFGPSSLDYELVFDADFPDIPEAKSAFHRRRQYRYATRNCCRRAAFATLGCGDR